MICNFTAKYRMSRASTLQRIGLAIEIALISALAAGCGYTYRPIVDVVPKPGGDPQPGRTALVVNTGGTTTQINVSGDTNMGDVSVGDTPVHATFLFGQSLAFVANRDEDNIAFYSPQQTSTQVQRVNLPSGSRPVFVTTRESSTQGNCQASSASNVACVYAACSGTNTVAVISAGQGLLQGDPIPVGNNPVALVETLNRTKIYVVNRDDASVSVIATGTMQNVGTIDVGADPVSAVINADGTRMYVVNGGSGTVSVVDTSTDTVLSELPVGTFPMQAAFDEKLRRLWVANSGSNNVSIFDVDADANRLLGTVAVGTAPVAIVALPDGTRAYVANSASDSVSVIDALSLQVSKTIPLDSGSVPANPVSIAAAPDSSKVFVANHGSNSVSSIATSSDTVVTSIPTPSGPVFVTVSP